MRFLRKNGPVKTVLVVSDLHLSAGVNLRHQRNFLEDFHADKELVDFLLYFSSGAFADREVELIINGDFLDFLAVPYVRYYDDEFWSEQAALDKLKMIIEAHAEVFDAMEKFMRAPSKKIVYVIGNHDAEMVLEGPREHFLSLFTDGVRAHLSILLNADGEYWPVPGVLVKHGHEYELAHHFHPQDSVVTDERGRRYFLPPWGSYYVTRVINRFKQDRGYINSVRPIRKFLIHGLAYDMVFTLRFMFATVFYFLMVRFIYTFRQGNDFKSVLKKLAQELKLFQDFESLTEDFLAEREDVRALIVGHSHDPTYRVYPHGAVFINTGTWTRMVNLDFDKRNRDEMLTFAQVDVLSEKDASGKGQAYDINLHVWKGVNHLPYQEFS
jgi:UDP-2,3-diacylglucosamine pyrophosphatase LpxH